MAYLIFNNELNNVESAISSNVRKLTNVYCIVFYYCPYQAARIVFFVKSFYFLLLSEQIMK